MSFRDLTSVYSEQWHEHIEYYLSDLQYSYTIMGVGMKSGSIYDLTFDANDHLVEVCLITFETD